MRNVETLADLPIDVAEAMYSPDFVELSTLSAGGTPVVLPMSFTLDIADNAVRFSSPVNAGRITNLVRDPRCCVSFTRVTSDHPPVVLQGIASLGEIAEGVRRGPARRFTVTPMQVFVLGLDASHWRFPAELPPPAEQAPPTEARRSSGTVVTADDLDAIVRFETTVAGLRDEDGWPITLPADIRRDGDALVVETADVTAAPASNGRMSLLGHTWTKDGPRYLALTCRASHEGSALRCHPIRALRRP